MKFGDIWVVYGILTCKTTCLTTPSAALLVAAPQHRLAEIEKRRTPQSR
jgi:hypothetical protein